MKSWTCANFGLASFTCFLLSSVLMIFCRSNSRTQQEDGYRGHPTRNSGTDHNFSLLDSSVRVEDTFVPGGDDALALHDAELRLEEGGRVDGALPRAEDEPRADVGVLDAAKTDLQGGGRQRRGSAQEGVEGD
jgi:hypothetical protein